jgi:hypothetical protein
MTTHISGIGNTALPSTSLQSNPSKPIDEGTADWFSASLMGASDNQIIKASQEFAPDASPSDISGQILAHIGDLSST